MRLQAIRLPSCCLGQRKVQRLKSVVKPQLCVVVNFNYHTVGGDQKYLPASIFLNIATLWCSDLQLLKLYVCRCSLQAGEPGTKLEYAYMAPRHLRTKKIERRAAHFSVSYFVSSLFLRKLGIFDFCAISRRRRLISKIRFSDPISSANVICRTRFDLRDSERRALEN